MANRFIYLLFHKPYGVLSQFTGEKGQNTLAEFGLPNGVYAAGRLDKESEGLLLLTNDGPLIHQLLNPYFAHPRTYWVQVEGIVSSEALTHLTQGVTIQGYRTQPCQARFFETQPLIPERMPSIRYRKNIRTSWIELTLTEGKNRQVRRMTAKIGYPTLRLIRVAIGSLKLNDLKPGHWRKIDRKEIELGEND